MSQEQNTLETDVSYSYASGRACSESGGVPHGEDAFWREEGSKFRKQLLQEDKKSGSFHIQVKQWVLIEEYFQIVDRIVTRILSRRNLSAEAYEDWPKLLDTYVKGSYVAEFMTRYLPLHGEYDSSLYHIELMRKNNERQLSNLVAFLDEASLAIDQEVFRRKALSNSKDDRGPELSFYLEFVEGTYSEDSFVPSVAPEYAVVEPNYRGSNNSTDPYYMEYKDPPVFPHLPGNEYQSEGFELKPKKNVSRDEDLFFSSTGSHISLLEEEHTEVSSNVRTKGRSRDRKMGIILDTKRTQKPESLVPGVCVSYFIHREEKQGCNSPKSVTELSSWLSEDDTVSTADMTHSGHSRGSSRFHSLLFIEDLDELPHEEAPGFLVPDNLSTTGSVLQEEDLAMLTKKKTGKQTRQRTRKCFPCDVVKNSARV